MNIKQVIKIIENLAPIEYAEKFDNVGLLIGSYHAKITNILITLDVTCEVINEAIHKNCNLIITFHPILFNSVKCIIKEKYQHNIIIKSIKNNINIYSCHTNLDVMFNGSNNCLSRKLNLIPRRVLIPQHGTTKKLTTYITQEYADKLKIELFKIGCGVFNNYDNCNFTFNGKGEFRCKPQANPFLGDKNITNKKDEICLNIIFPSHKHELVKNVLFKYHPYEEVPYEIYDLKYNDNIYIGNGLLCDVRVEIRDIDFLYFIKHKLQIKYIKYSKLLNKKINKIAIMVGSGSFGLDYAKQCKVDVYISSDIKYHDFFVADNQMLIIDIGHYESEKFVKKFLFKYLSEKIINLTILESEINTNPIYTL
jgi:dinuclear metal center YbgI/SA1388 family protein